jgi:hypothetical protein
VHHRHSSVVCTSVVRPLFVCLLYVLLYVRCLYIRHSSVICMSVVRPSFVCHTSIICLPVVHLPVICLLFICPLFIHRVIRTSFVVVCPLSFHPGSTPRAVAHEAGGRWYVIVCCLSYFSRGGMAGYEVHRVCTSRVSPPRVSQCPSAPSSPVLTSHLNGEEGVASFTLAPIVGRSS